MPKGHYGKVNDNSQNGRKYSVRDKHPEYLSSSYSSTTKSIEGNFWSWEGGPGLTGWEGGEERER